MVNVVQIQVVGQNAKQIAQELQELTSGLFASDPAMGIIEVKQEIQKTLARNAEYKVINTAMNRLSRS